MMVPQPHPPLPTPDVVRIRKPRWTPEIDFAKRADTDSDVVAAAYGQLAGAYHGVSAIPGIWRNSLMKQEVVIDTADRLLTHALVTLGT